MQEQIRASINRTNLLRLAASIVVALVLWGWVSTLEDPKTSRTFPDVAIATRDLGEGLVITSTIPNVRVDIDGPRSDINGVNAAATLPYLDLSEISEPGQYTLDIGLVHPDGLWHTKVSPSRLTVTVERQTSKDFPLETEISGAVGSSQNIGTIRPVTTTVTVVGAESSVAKVAKVVLPIVIENQTRDFVSSFTPIARDASGNEVTGVTITPGSISATVPISARGKSVAVIVQPVGQPADGYRVTNTVSSPQTVIVDGPDDVINSMIAVSAGPVDVEGKTSTVQQEVPIFDLPPDVKVISPADGKVAVQVTIVQEGVRQELSGQPIQHVNLGAGLGVEIQPSEVSIVVTGPSAALAALKTDDIIVRVDLAGLGPGTYTLEPDVLLPQSLTFVSASPETVTVRIVSVGANATPANQAPPDSDAQPPPNATTPEPTQTIPANQ
jgi:YbbR domain-containing protein